MKNWVIPVVFLAVIVGAIYFIFVLNNTDKPDYVFQDIFIYGTLNVSLGKKVYVIYDGDDFPSQLNAEITKNIPNLVFSLSKKGYNVSTIALSYDNVSKKYIRCVSYENYTLEQCLGLINTSSVIWFKYPTQETNSRIILQKDDIIVYPKNSTDYLKTTLFVNEFLSGNFKLANH